MAYLFSGLVERHTDVRLLGGGEFEQLLGVVKFGLDLVDFSIRRIQHGLLDTQEVGLEDVYVWILVLFETWEAASG